MLAVWPCISHFISLYLNFLICKMGCYEGKVNACLVKRKKKHSTWNHGCPVAVGSISGGGDGGEHGSSLISPVGPSSPAVLGTDLGPTKHVSSETRHCLLLSVHCLVSLLSSLLKKYFPFNIFISTVLKVDMIQKSAVCKCISQWVFTPVWPASRSRNTTLQNSYLPCPDKPPRSLSGYSPFIILTSNVKD